LTKFTRTVLPQSYDIVSLYTAQQIQTRNADTIVSEISVDVLR